MNLRPTGAISHARDTASAPGCLGRRRAPLRVIGEFRSVPPEFDTAYVPEDSRMRRLLLPFIVTATLVGCRPPTPSEIEAQTEENFAQGSHKTALKELTLFGCDFAFE